MRTLRNLRTSAARAATCARRRPMSSTVSVTIAEAKSKTAAALRRVGWDEDDAALREPALARRKRGARMRLEGTLCARTRARMGCAGVLPRL